MKYNIDNTRTAGRDRPPDRAFVVTRSVGAQRCRADAGKADENRNLRGIGMGMESRIRAVTVHLRPRTDRPLARSSLATHTVADATEAVAIEGSVSPGWEKVRTAFAENFAQRDELGASCCVTYRGEVVVDLCTRHASSVEP